MFPPQEKKKKKKKKKKRNKESRTYFFTLFFSRLHGKDSQLQQYIQSLISTQKENES